MKALLFFCLTITVTLAVLIPIETDSQRCMIIYSMNHEDTIKIGLKFPNDHRVSQFYDYNIKVKDLSGNVVLQDKITNQIWKTQVAVPNQTIYEACISIVSNETKSSNSSVRYKGEILVNYEANTHFVSANHKMPDFYQTIKEEQVTVMKAQVEDIINITKQFIELQKIQRDQQTKQYEQKRSVDQSLFDWWMIELILIIGLGIVQWNRMKKKLQTKND